MTKMSDKNKVNNKSIQNELVPLSSNQKQVGQASHLCVFCVETTIDEAYIRAFFDRIISINNTPDAVLSPFRSSVISSFESKSDEEKILVYLKNAIVLSKQLKSFGYKFELITN